MSRKILFKISQLWPRLPQYTPRKACRAGPVSCLDFSVGQTPAPASAGGFPIVPVSAPARNCNDTVQKYQL